MPVAKKRRFFMEEGPRTQSTLLWLFAFYNNTIKKNIMSIQNVKISVICILFFYENPALKGNRRLFWRGGREAFS
jgi:hypothetical protein